MISNDWMPYRKRWMLLRCIRYARIRTRAQKESSCTRAQRGAPFHGSTLCSNTRLLFLASFSPSPLVLFYHPHTPNEQNINLSAFIQWVELRRQFKYEKEKNERTSQAFNNSLHCARAVKDSLIFPTRKLFPGGRLMKCAFIQPTNK